MKSIAVIYGSDSSEWEVSVRSGQFTASQVDGEKYDVYEIFARFGVGYTFENLYNLLFCYHI